MLSSIYGEVLLSLFKETAVTNTIVGGY